jgi:quaternary ammonium compound-resistance protein SugE
MAWIYLVVAALFETAWTYAVKYLKFSAFKQLTFTNFYKTEGLLIMAPLAAYIIFGISNVYFFSLALKQVSTATAFAVWTAVTLVFLKISEIVFLQQSISWTEAFFMLLIMAGIIGLKYNTVIE